MSPEGRGPRPSVCAACQRRLCLVLHKRAASRSETLTGVVLIPLLEPDRVTAGGGRLDSGRVRLITRSEG